MWIYWLILRSGTSFWGKTIVVAMVTKLVAMVTIMVAMEIEPVAMEFMTVTSETKVGCQHNNFTNNITSLFTNNLTIVSCQNDMLTLHICLKDALSDF